MSYQLVGDLCWRSHCQLSIWKNYFPTTIILRVMRREHWYFVCILSTMQHPTTFFVLHLLRFTLELGCLVIGFVDKLTSSKVCVFILKNQPRVFQAVSIVSNRHKIFYGERSANYYSCQLSLFRWKLKERKFYNFLFQFRQSTWRHENDLHLHV